ncbi:nucleotide exchange factor GrpE [Candidatus Saccharibacteria bacterium]|nr:nucleotide exchange factor GrpE [Candidatus Saccharibacteria bacterium]
MKKTENTKPETTKPEAEQLKTEQATQPSETDAKITELINDLQRTRADFENFRKNVEKDRDNAKKLAKLSTVEKFLPLLDDLNRAIQTYDELKPLEKSFEKSLKNLGLEKIDTKQGTEFNPELHDAVMTEGDGDKEIIAETLRDGYFYEGEVLRPAMVKIKLQ